MDEYRQKVRYAVEFLTRLHASSGTGDRVASVRTDLDTITGLAGAGLMLAVIAGTEHGIRDEHESVDWALERLRNIAGSNEDDLPQVEVEDVAAEGMMTIHRLVRLLHAVAAQLPMGVDNEVKVGIQSNDGVELGDDVAVSTLADLHQDGRSGVVAFVSGVRGKDVHRSTREWAAPDIVSHFLTHCVREARGVGGFAGEWEAIKGFAAEIGSRQTDAVSAAREEGISWAEIAAVIGEPVAELRAKYEQQ